MRPYNEWLNNFLVNDVAVTNYRRVWLPSELHERRRLWVARPYDYHDPRLRHCWLSARPIPFAIHQPAAEYSVAGTWRGRCAPINFQVGNHALGVMIEELEIYLIEQAIFTPERKDA